MGVGFADIASWDQVNKVAEEYNKPAARTRRDFATNSSLANAPLAGMLANPSYFGVDYCARYTCKCYKPFSTVPGLEWINGKNWETGSGSVGQKQVRPGCVAQITQIKDNQVVETVCMWDRRVCNCNSEEFFDQGGVAFLYPQLVTNGSVTSLTENTVDGNFTPSAARMNNIRANRISDTDNQCIQCQTGFVLSGGQCYIGGSTNVGMLMAITIGLTAVPALLGMWYVLHSIVDPTDTGMEVGDVKKVK